MANETAATYVPLGREGTGYATILQNNILPSLQNEQRRADRLYQMEEVAKAAAAKAAQKKAEDEAKFALPYVKAGPAGYWQPEVDRLRSRLLAEAKPIFTNPNIPQGQRINAINDIQAQVDATVNEGAFRSQRMKDLLPDLQKSGFAGANERSLAQYYASRYGNPDFFNQNDEAGYVQFLKSNPENNVSPRIIGETLSKQFQPVKLSVQGKNRTTETFEYSPMFEAEKVYDPLLKANVIKAVKPNIPDIQKALQGNPAMLEAADSWIDKKTEGYMKANPQLQRDAAYNQALTDFWGEATKGLAKSTYDYNIPAPTGKGSGSGKPQPVVKELAPVAVSFTNVPNYDPSVAPKYDDNAAEPLRGNPKPYSAWTDQEKEALTQQGGLDLGMGLTHYFEKPQVASSNKEVILLSNNKDAIDAGLVSKSKKGGYTLKTGFSYQATTPITVRVFKEDTPFPFNGPTKYTIDKYTPVTDDTYLNMSREQKDKYTTTVKGHLISPMGGVPEETEAGVLKYSPSKVASTQVVVLDESAEDIRAAMKRADKKGTAPKQSQPKKWKQW